MHLLASDNPRTLYLVTSPHEERQGRPSRVLVFRAAEHNLFQTVVEFLPKDAVDLESAVRLTNKSVHGCLGLISVGNEIFLALVTAATEVGNTRPSTSDPERVAKIDEIAFYSITGTSQDDLASASDALPSPGSEYPEGGTSSSTAEGRMPPPFEHPCSPLAKIFSAGFFYFAMEPHWDISSRLSERLARKKDEGGPRDIAAFDERFIWNEYVVRGLLDFREKLDLHERADMDRCQFLVVAIQGYVGMHTIALPAPPTNGAPTVATLTVISRLGKKRAGTRFNTRGVDDEGNCANFVETETLFSTDQHYFSYVQVRGSVPLFWEQQGFQTFNHKIQITRPNASQPAFDRHFAQLTDEYGSTHAINLLGSKENETSLSMAYNRHLQAAKGAFGNDVGITHFDFHNATKATGHESIPRELRNLPSLRDNMERFGFSMSDAETDDVLLQQTGVFRVNCLDCLDRTNFVEDILSRTALEQFLSLVRREWSHANTLWNAHRDLWANNGDALSKIYAGTGALNTSFTRTGKRTFAGLVSDATKSVSRAYINNFQDKNKQAAIDMFLGTLSDQRQVTIFDPIHDSVRAALEQRLEEYSTQSCLSVFAGTWNLNGRPPSSESLKPWLRPDSTAPTPDIIALGFQEIVPLTAQQIVQTDPEKRRVWERRITQTLAEIYGPSAYILLRSEQLVGTALLVFVQTHMTADIRRVEGASRKTGLRGMSGNKGGVAIRLQYHDTTFCFVTAHLAAGHSNVDERNADYWTIHDGLRFPKGLTIDNHDHVVWAADTNYRIDDASGPVRDMVLSDQIDELIAIDQLTNALSTGSAFVDYSEGPLTFRPTYKYDLGTDRYDTSEKMRVPAWTDRILYKGSGLHLETYYRAELRGSDHKPVFATFSAAIRIVDEAKKASIAKMLADNVVVTAPGEKLDEKLARLTFPIEASDDLPPPSSEENAWWNKPEHPEGVFPVSPSPSPPLRSTNPFDSPPPTSLSASPSSSEELNYKAAMQASSQAFLGRKVPPPPPRRNGDLNGG